MQVLCMASNDEKADVTCPSCGQKYAVYYSRQFSPERAKALDSVRAALVQHHVEDASANAHPSTLFNVPAWSGPAHMSAAALLSGAPVRQMVKVAAETSVPEQLAS